MEWTIQDPIPEVVEEVARKCEGLKSILDIGPGTNPFPPATQAVDHRDWDYGIKTRKMDFNQDQLPEIQYDFIYCRHVIEDLYNPVNLLKQIWSSTERGFIETPSPMHELHKGVDGDGPLRGYHHHKWIIWTEDDTLMLLPKSNLLEHWEVEFPQSVRKELVNNYYYFEDKIKFRIFEYEVDFSVYNDSYYDLILRSIEQSIEHTNKLVSRGSFKLP